MIGPATILRRAYKKISTPRKWTYGGLATDSRGHCVPPKSRRAVKFCAVGALDSIRCAHADRQTALFELTRAAYFLHASNPIALNDCSPRTAAYRRVRVMYRLAIKALERRK